MQKNNIQDSLAALEYMLGKYYDENFSKVLSAEKKKFDKEKANLTTQVFMTGLGSQPMTGSYNSALAKSAKDLSLKHVDDMFEAVEKKVLSQSNVQHDIAQFTKSFRSLLIARLGEDKYDALSKESDLASVYVHHFITSKMVAQCGKMDMPKSSLQYIVERGCKQTFIGFLFSAGNSEIEQRVQESVERQYDPSTLEKAAGEAVAFGIDTATLGGFSTATKVGRVALTIEGVARTYEVAKDYDDGDPYFEEFSRNVFGTSRALAKVRSQKISASSNKDVHNFNEQLNNKLHLPKLELHIDRKEQTELQQRICSQSGENGMKMAEIACSILDKNNIEVDVDKPIPGWMKKKNETENIRLSSYYLALALEMKDKQKSAIKIQGKSYSYETVCQRAFDYARTAADQRRSTEQTLQQEQAAAVAQYYTAAQQVAVQQYQQQMQQAALQQVQQGKGNDGWNALLESLGLKGFGSISKNLGYTLAMLPEMLADMITGRSKNNKLKDNLFGLGVIFAAFFVRNKLLKLMLFMLGGASLINKAGQSLLDKSSAQTRVFKKYSDEPLDARIRDVVLKGRTMLATIDGVPEIITLSDDAVTAYEKGKLPLNTLANAVLAKHDEMSKDMANSYEKNVREGEKESNNIGIR